ncbi:MAG: inositol monophosphatase [Rhodobacterales bacterium 34-62-10]|nr:MAG: inositol monophosphatase [Rhodobacterales bacterium 34-62-10]
MGRHRANRRCGVGRRSWRCRVTPEAQDADDLELALQAADAAGQILMHYWLDRQNLSIHTKRAGDFLSQADLEAEACLKTILLGARPDDGWLGEETGASHSARRRWIVDPLDGTTNFLRGIPHWAVSIALEVDGQRRLGVVHDPVKAETFSAHLGHGAHQNGAPIHVSGTDDLSAALFGTGIPFGGMAHIDDHAADIAALMPHCAGVRRMGAAALDLAYVAAGRLDGFWERRLQQWDIAAGLVILHESGARTAALDPAERPEATGTVMTATPMLFDAFAKLLRDQTLRRA